MHFDERVVTGEKPKGRQGFASMTPDRVKQIAAMGGRAANAKGVAHKWDKRSGSAAGKKSAMVRRLKKTAA